MSCRTCTFLWTPAGIGLSGMALSYFLCGPARFWANWILWFLFLLTLALGCLFLVALEHLVAARWSVPIRRLPERLSTLLLPLVPVALVALFALPVLYPGSRPEALQNPVLAGKAAWLGLPFFSLRTLLCVAAGLLSLAVLVRGSLRQDHSKDPAFNRRARKFAPVFMALFAFIVTVVAFDWISGLTPEWYSDIFGVYIFAGGFLAGLAATAVALHYLQKRGRLAGVNAHHRYNLGAFLFAFTVFWSYIGFAQYMLMWYGNLPEEVVWYRLRLEGAWHHVTLLLALLHFLVPFFALVTRTGKGHPRIVFGTACLMLFAHVLDLYWLIFPVLGRGVLLSWPELSFALFFLSGALLWIRRALHWGEDMPVGDPFLQQGLEFRL